MHIGSCGGAHAPPKFTQPLWHPRPQHTNTHHNFKLHYGVLPATPPSFCEPNKVCTCGGWPPYHEIFHEILILLSVSLRRWERRHVCRRVAW